MDDSDFLCFGAQEATAAVAMHKAEGAAALSGSHWLEGRQRSQPSDFSMRAWHSGRLVGNEPTKLGFQLQLLEIDGNVDQQ